MTVSVQSEEALQTPLVEVTNSNCKRRLYIIMLQGHLLGSQLKGEVERGGTG